VTITLASFTRRYAFPLWGWYFCGLVALAATNLIMLRIPQLAKTIVNAVAESRDLAPMEQVALAIIGLGLLQIVIRSLSRILIFWPGRTLESAAKSDLFSRVMRIPQQVLLKFGMGDLISRLANDMGQLRAFFAFAFLQAANLLFLAVFTVNQMLAAHSGLTIACLAPLALMILITKFSMPRLQKFSRENQDAVGQLTTRVTEAFVNVHVLQANAAEKAFVDRTESDNSAVYETNIKLVFIRNVIFPLMTCLAGLAQVTVLFYGGYEVLAGRLTIGDILAFNIYIGLLSFPLTALGFVLALYQRAVTAAERISAIDDAPVEYEHVGGTPHFTGTRPASSSSPSSSPSSPPSKELLRIANLNWCFSTIGLEHQGNAGDQSETPFQLSGINLQIQEGQRIGLFGPIGSGKSTLFSLITRIFDPPRGTIFWQGVDILDMDPRELRQQVGLAQQTVHLFSDTIEANLRLGLEDRGLTHGDLEKAASDAQILDEIRGFEKGWQTEIGENGIRLSGGQKQRLALARLFLRKPKLMVLDDVLSAVDHLTEARLTDFFYRKSGSLIIASNRPSALQKCDEILILERGAVTARGTWAEIAGHIRSI